MSLPCGDLDRFGLLTSSGMTGSVWLKVYPVKSKAWCDAAPSQISHSQLGHLQVYLASGGAIPELASIAIENMLKQ